MRLRPNHVRTRLTLWYVLMLAGVLTVYLAGVSLLLFWQVRGVLERLAIQDLETVKGLLYTSADGRLLLREDFHHHSDWKRVQDRLLEVLTPSGAILYRNERLGDRTIGEAPFPKEGEDGYSQRFSRLSDGTRIILTSRRYLFQDRWVLIRAAYSQDLIWKSLKETLVILLLALPLALASVAYAGYRMASKALDPIEHMSRRAAQINSERLHERLPIDNAEDELGHLAHAFNDMLTRIEQSFEQLKHFTSDASHELRTPLAAIKSTGEVGLQQDRSAEDYREIIGSILEEVNRLTDLADSLLMLSRADAGQIPMRPSVFSLMELAREAASLLDVLLEEKGLIFTVSGNSQLFVKGDRSCLRQAVINILHNAIKFTPPKGTIAACISEQEDSAIVLSVTDSGPGVAPEHAMMVFERFYRIDPGQSGSKGSGAGLGLAIAKWAVEANHGEIGVTSKGAEGSSFWIRLPCSPHSKPP